MAAMDDRFDWGDRLPTLGAARVDLRWLGPDDVPALFGVFSDPEVMRYWDSAPLADPEAAARLLRHIHDRFAARTLFQWGIARRSDDLVIGTCTLFNLDVANRRGEIGFALGRAHWGQGLASEAVGTLIGFAFGPLGLYRLEADADPRNTASLRTLERQGFRQEGYLRERFRVGDGTQDSVFLGLLRREWTGGQTS